jgi:hypothetical protein
LKQAGVEKSWGYARLLRRVLNLMQKTCRTPAAWAAGVGWSGGKSGSRPVSRVLSRTTIPLGRTSPHASSDLPGSGAGHALPLAGRASLFGLAPGGVCRAVTVASPAVRSYRTLSPLPRLPCGSVRRFAFCCTFRGLAPPRRYLAPCPAEPGLSSPATGCPVPAAVVRPAPALSLRLRRQGRRRRRPHPAPRPAHRAPCA